MTQYVDNPAGRLEKLLRDLHAAYPRDQQQKQMQAWAAVVELIDNEAGVAGEAQIVGNVAALPAQIRDSVARLSVDVDRKEQLLLHLDEVEQGIRNMLTRQPLYNMFVAFATNGEVPRSATISSLAHCSYELHRSLPERTISDEDLASIIEQIHDLMRGVAEAKLPEEVKRAMLNHLTALLQAANNVRFSGAQPLDDALFALAGSAFHRGPVQEDLSQAGLWDRFKDFMQTLNLMLTTGQSAGQIGQGVAGFLGG
ncbi:hypothetical protein [Streptomyces sp. 184]|uniref:hypothetical protein n=1 Tax=Streptomyces sp. 184 TaxID=1827526 RepID=UPI0038922B70